MKQYRREEKRVRENNAQTSAFLTQNIVFHINFLTEIRAVSKKICLNVCWPVNPPVISNIYIYMCFCFYLHVPNIISQNVFLFFFRLPASSLPWAIRMGRSTSIFHGRNCSRTELQIFQERATNKMPSCAMLCQSNHATLGGLDATHSHAASSTCRRKSSCATSLGWKTHIASVILHGACSSERSWKLQICQRNTTIKGTRPNFPHCFRDGQTCQRAAAIKSTLSDFCHWVRDVQPCQRAAASKGIVSNRHQTRKECQNPQRAAAVKGAILYACHRLWDGQSCQRASANKGALPNLGHRCRYA